MVVRENGKLSTENGPKMFTSLLNAQTVMVFTSIPITTFLLFGYQMTNLAWEL